MCHKKVDCESRSGQKHGKREVTKSKCKVCKDEKDTTCLRNMVDEKRVVASAMNAQ